MRDGRMRCAMVGCDAIRGTMFSPRAAHRAMRCAREKHRASYRILPSRIASYHRASHPTIAHRILPSHDFSRLHAWSFSAIIRSYVRLHSNYIGSSMIASTVCHNLDYSAYNVCTAGSRVQIKCENKHN